MEKTWKPTTAGILSIVAGAFGVIGGLLVYLTAGGIVAGPWGCPMYQMGPHMPFMFPIPIILGVAIPTTVLGILSIVGGTFSLKRRIWGLALAGAICALFGPWFVLGLLAIIFVALGRSEFK
jgi:hypothetical protein